MANSKIIAGLIGPSIVAITLSETVNIHIWAGNTAAGKLMGSASNGTNLSMLQYAAAVAP